MNLSSFTTGTIFEALFISFVSCLIITFLSTKFAVRTNLLDIPASQPHKVHQKPVPISGGLAFFVTLWLCCVLMRHDLSLQIIKLLIAATIIFIFGLWDDYSPLKPYQKIIGQIIASIALITFGTQAQIVESFPLPFPLNPYLMKSIDIGIAAKENPEKMLSMAANKKNSVIGADLNFGLNFLFSKLSHFQKK